MNKPERVYFYVNGPARLLMAAVIAEELYSGIPKHLILLDQYDYCYEGLLPHVESNFASVQRLKIDTNKYSHLNQFVNCYFNQFPDLRRVFQGNADVILFGIRSPAQKFIIRHNKKLGNQVKVFAENLHVGRFFYPKNDNNLLVKLTRNLFARAFDFQHDYDVFFVFNEQLYKDSPLANSIPSKIAQMPNLFGSQTFLHYANILTASLDLEAIANYKVVFFGQPNERLVREDEQALLIKILGDKKVLVLPHPQENLEGENKYCHLKNATIFRSSVPNDLLLARLNPEETITFSSTIGITYALANPGSRNHFFPLHRSQFDMLKQYEQLLPNLSIHDRFVTDTDPHQVGHKQKIRVPS